MLNTNDNKNFGDEKEPKRRKGEQFQNYSKLLATTWKMLWVLLNDTLVYSNKENSNAYKGGRQAFAKEIQPMVRLETQSCAFYLPYLMVSFG